MSLIHLRLHLEDRADSIGKYLLSTEIIATENEYFLSSDICLVLEGSRKFKAVEKKKNSKWRRQIQVLDAIPLVKFHHNRKKKKFLLILSFERKQI